jgi:ubiquinone/menaquinone biosynthesis C-methylase UbiE
MTSKSFLPTSSVLEARYQAQKIAFGPVIFQCVRIARDNGLLKAIEAAGEGGIEPAEAARQAGVSEYAAKVVCEPAVTAGVIDLVDGRYVLTMVGHLLLNDEMTRANMDFNDLVCYEPLMHLEASLKTGKPEGLKVFGSWPTVYEGLSQLPPQVQEAWFRFDHLYSDSAFPHVAKIIAEHQPQSLLDVGGNTGRWARFLTARVPGMQVTIADLPQQLAMAQQTIEAAGLSDRINYHPVNLLDVESELPTGFDAVWLSQFLSCFSEAEVVQILRKAARGLNAKGRIFILDNFWDRQPQDIAAYCIAHTTPYFCCVANGNSRMYTFADLEKLIHAAELKVEQVYENLGLGHSLVKLSLPTNQP